MSTKPTIEKVEPAVAIPGGEVIIRGRDLHGADGVAPRVMFGKTPAPIIFATGEKIIARVPEGAGDQSIQVQTDTGSADGLAFQVAVSIADGLHPVANPAVDSEGNVYATFSGARGQSVPVSVYRLGRDLQSEPYIRELVNATGLAFDQQNNLYISSRNEGVVYRVSPGGERERFAEGMGIATGVAFDASGSLFVGDRSGSVFKVGADGQIFVFATLEASVSAFHLAFGPEGLLYVTGPTTTSFDAVYRITVNGEVEVFYRGLGRPQGMAFDTEGNLYVAASLHGRRGIVCITPKGDAELAVAGNNLVGLAFAPDRRLVLATNSGVYELRWNSDGLPLPPRPSA